jgi:hypothetical protein
MEELIEYFNNADVIQLYDGKYNEVLRTLYIVLQRAVKDRATSIEINNDEIVLKSNGQTITGMSLKMLANGRRLHIDNMFVLLEKDAVVNKYVTTSLQDEMLICTINW